MHPRPLPDKFLGGTGFHLTFKQLAIEIESSILSLILRMKMGRAMVPVKHTDDDTKKYADCRHNKLSTRSRRPSWAPPALTYRSPSLRRLVGTDLELHDLGTVSRGIILDLGIIYRALPVAATMELLSPGGI